MPGPSEFLPHGDAYEGNFLSCSKGGKDPCKVQEGRHDFPREATTEKGLISPARENLLIFLDLRQVPLELQQGPQGPAGVASGKNSLHASCEGPLQIPLQSVSGLGPSLEERPKLEVLSPVLKWILGFLWILHRRVRTLLKWRHTRPFSSGAVAAVSSFPTSGHRDLWLSLEMSQSCRTCHRGVIRCSG